ncbi:unnamed protein product [Schistosoma margrebowiei]|uniref:Uncharacterized protein n=1 Tax=Schistosoma margrebowiei TaxID=48269 RepID=A0A183N6X2_9TREM|nr:unnamed protein product [Schistosoma margrebowiei]
MGFNILREQMPYDPIVGHRLLWDCISRRCFTDLWIRPLGRRLWNELESLIGHSCETVASLAVTLLLRLLHHFPHLAHETVANTIIPYLCTRSNKPDHFTLPLLSMLPDAVMLAPHSASTLMQLCAEHILLGVPNEFTYSAVDYYEVSMRRLTLDGFDGACIEHASSALTASSGLVRASL